MTVSMIDYQLLLPVSGLIYYAMLFPFHLSRSRLILVTVLSLPCPRSSVLTVFLKRSMNCNIQSDMTVVPGIPRNMTC